MKETCLGIFLSSVVLLALHEADKLPMYDWIEQVIYFVGGAALLMVLFYRRYIFRRRR